MHEERDLLSVPLAFRPLHGDHAQVLAIINLQAIDVFVNAALRLQALDHSLLATHFSSITSSVTVYKSLEYTFFLNVDSLIVALEAIIRDAREKLMVKGDAYCDYAANLLTAAKMGSAYGRLSLCMMNATLNTCPLPFHCCTATTPMVLHEVAYLLADQSLDSPARNVHLYDQSKSHR